jgi:hypothetical protein
VDLCVDDRGAPLIYARRSYGTPTPLGGTSA